MDYFHKNYDPVFKESLILFKNKTLDFLGLSGIAPITEPLMTESIEIEIKIEIRDLSFGTQDGCGLHFEEEVDLSRDDMLRFCSYNTGLSRVYKREFITVIFVKNPTTLKEIQTDQLVFKPIIVQCSKFDADLILDRLKQDITAGIPINELELVYLPLFYSIKLSPTELFKESTKLIKDLKVDDDRKRKLYGLSILLANKVVEQSQLEITLREVINMGNIIIETAENMGTQRGIKIGTERQQEESALKMLSDGLDVLDIIRYTGIDAEKLSKIRDSIRKQAV